MSRADFTFRFAIMAGSPSSDELIRPFIWGPQGIADLFGSHLRSSYGDALRRIVLRVFVEGRYPMTIPARGVSAYRAKDGEISANIPLGKPFILAPKSVTRAKLLAESIMWVTSTIAGKSDLNGVRVDDLLVDVERTLNIFLNAWTTVDAGSMARQLLILQVPLKKLRKDQIVALENEMLSELGVTEEIDGHDIDTSHASLFILTRDPVTTFSKVSPVLRRHELLEHVSALSQRLGASDSVPISRQ